MVIKTPSGGRMRVYCATGNGVRAGPYTEWSSGKLRAAGENTDGKLAGRFTRWDRAANGETRKVGEENYVDGALSGDFATWDLDGNLLVRGRYAGGKKQGRFLENSVAGGEVKFAGVCYEADTEQWRTEDPAEFTTKECRDPDAS
jgi:antitoxin component YwqK of YwqJK toxin-antitoxin module